MRIKPGVGAGDEPDSGIGSDSSNHDDSDNAQSSLANRGQYLAFASKVMRSFLVDHARRKGADKRGGNRDRVTLSGVKITGDTDVELLTIHDLLESLAEFDAELGKIAEFRIFGGLSQDEIADVLGLPKRTLERRWSVASAWLRRELER